MSIDLPDDLNEEMARPASLGSIRPDLARLDLARLDTTRPALTDARDEAPIEDEIVRDTFGLCLAGPGKAAGRETAAVRLDKVAKVRAALSAGTYSVPAEAVAVKMLDAMLALEQKRVIEDRRKRPRVGHRRLMRGRARREN